MRTEKKINVFNSKGEYIKTFDSMHPLIEMFGMSRYKLREAIKNEELILGRYYISRNEKINPDNIQNVYIEELETANVSSKGEWQKLKESNLYKMLMN